MVEVVDLQIKYKLTSCMAKAIYLLLTNKVVTAKMLEADTSTTTAITTDSKVLMHRIRRRMSETGIKIESQRSVGYWIEQATRDRILRDIGDNQISLPFDLEGKGEPIAA